MAKFFSEIAVLLPVRNGVGTLDVALESLVAQSFPGWRCVVIDDHSTDATPEILARWRQREPERVVVRQNPGRGIVAALNAGLAASHEPWIARMDADDVSEPTRLERQRDWLVRHPDLGVVSCLVQFGGDREQAAGYARYVDWINSVVTPEQIWRSRFIESPLAHPSVLFRRELAQAHAGYRAGNFPEDYDLWLRWLQAGVRIGKVPEILLRWNDPPARLSRTDSRYDPGAFYALKTRYLLDWWQRKEEDRRRNLWLWGAGRVTRRRFGGLVESGLLRGFVDIDPRKQGQRPAGRGLPVIAPDALGEPGETFVLTGVGSLGARDRIAAYLQKRGYQEGRDYLHAA